MKGHACRIALLPAASATATACGGNAGPLVGDTGAARTIDFTGSGVHVFAAEWLVIQPNVSGSVRSETDVAYAPATWTAHPRALEAQSLSLCGNNLNERESISNLEAAGFPLPPALANIRLVRVSEDQTPIPFCTGVHHVNRTWSFQHGPVLPIVDPALGQATGETSMIEDQVDLVAILFERDVFVRSIHYQTSRSRPSAGRST